MPGWMSKDEGRDCCLGASFFPTLLTGAYLLIYSGVQRPLPVGSSFQRRDLPHQEDRDEQAGPISAPADPQLGTGEIAWRSHRACLGTYTSQVKKNSTPLPLGWRPAPPWRDKLPLGGPLHAW